NCAWVRTKDQILDEGWFGRQISDQAKERLGEIALLARDPVAFLDKENPGPKLVGRHGSLTETEVYVPLITSFKE
ncbi:MAG: PglZ domain-containing protein, partial [Actinomycetota bacterium]|nr:PglZ domain-containing protein [Actinomycetota bacterium]